jgi:phenylpropionate dioxygenase-like ring-hydroxylating dioxygenase large terminal subunit
MTTHSDGSPSRLQRGTQDNYKVFNRTDRVVEAWYWAVPSHELPPGTVKAVRVAGKDLAIFRGKSGKVTALDAHCPHMGAHLAEGRVEGDSLRCFFHHWKFDDNGRCVEAPCQDKPPSVEAKTRTVLEHYGMVWVWVGDGAPSFPVPEVPELAGQECDVAFGNPFIKMCHPNVVLINAIDAQHFHSVHRIPNILRFETTEIDAHTIRVSNMAPVPERSNMRIWRDIDPFRPIFRVADRFYSGPVTYSMTYWGGTVGTVSLGPDAQHFHIMFALRPGDGGITEGQTILVTKKRTGVVGQAISRTFLELTKHVGNYFADGDTKIFTTIKFHLKTPLKSDRAIVDFIQHFERQRPVAWGYGQDLDGTSPASPERGQNQDESESRTEAPAPTNVRRLHVIGSSDGVRS